MKPVIFLLLWLFFGTGAFSQVDTLTKNTHEYYMEKYENQKRGAMLFFLVGGIGSTATFLSSEKQSLKALGSFLNQTTPEKHHSYVIPYVISFVCIGGGGALLLSAGKNKRKSRAISFYPKIEQFPVFQAKSITQHSYPLMAVRIKW